MRIGCLGIMAISFIGAILLALAREYAPVGKICKVTFNDNTVETYECRYVDEYKNYIVVGTEAGKINIPMSSIKMFAIQRKELQDDRLERRTRDFPE